MDIPVAEEVILGGRYRLRALLGAGGMAQVYDGLDERLDRPVAVKLLRPDLAAQSGLPQRFELEARAAARLSHPNVVAVYDAGDDNGRSFIVMERLRGESLADVIGRGPVDVAWLRRLAGEVLSALSAAHEAGIIHRDIKPANILLGPNGQAKVADFGIARVAEAQLSAEPAAALTGAGLVLGTPAYLAPERVMGEPATPQSDLYSLGVVLYEALTGRKPFVGATPVAVASAVAHGAAENPYVLRPDADPQLVAVMARAMSRDPGARYATAAEMAGDLRREPPPPTAVLPVGAAAVAPTVAMGPDLAASPLPAARPTPPPLGRPAPAPPPHAPMPPAPGRPAGPPASRLGGRRGLALVGGAAIVAIVLALAVALGGTGGTSRASTTPTTAHPTTTAKAPTAPTAPTAPASPTTAPSVVSSQSDPIAVALKAVADSLSRSKSAVASQLASALSSVAAIADPAARADAASSLLNQAVQWYQGGQLTAGEYVTATALLHQAGAPQAPPPTVKSRGKSGGGGGGD